MLHSTASRYLSAESWGKTDDVSIFILATLKKVEEEGHALFEEAFGSSILFDDMKEALLDEMRQEICYELRRSILLIFDASVYCKVAVDLTYTLCEEVAGELPTDELLRNFLELAMSTKDTMNRSFLLT